MATRKRKKSTSSTTTVGGKTYSKGESFTDSSGRTGTVKYSAETGRALSDPISSSTKVRADNYATGVDLRALKKAYASDNSALAAERAALAERRSSEISGIKTEFDIAKQAQELGQAGEFASRSTKLITSGGGFLGATQSHEGVLENLRGNFETEKTALMAKREAAIRAAEQAYEDRDFALARELSKNAKEMQNEIYRRQKDFADQTLAVSRENRAQSEFDRDQADKKIAAFSLMDDDTFNNLSPEEIRDIDAQYFPGYAKAARDIAKKAAEAKSTADKAELDIKILNVIRQIPAGKKVNIGGTVYSGMKPAPTGSSKGNISPAIAYQIGVPSLAGKDESDVILSFNLAKPPQWYVEYYKTNYPEIYKNLTPDQLVKDWEIFKAQPDIQAYKNSSVVSKRIEVSGSILDNLNLSEADFGALDED